MSILVPVLAACSDDSTGPQMPDFTGTYAYSGTVNGAPTADIVGTLSLTSQVGNQVTVVHTATFRSSGQAIGTIFTQVPAQGSIQMDGSVSWTLIVGGDTFRNAGTLAGNRITGTWTVTGSASLAGNFSATR